MYNMAKILEIDEIQEIIEDNKNLYNWMTEDNEDVDIDDKISNIEYRISDYKERLEQDIEYFKNEFDADEEFKKEIIDFIDDEYNKYIYTLDTMLFDLRWEIRDMEENKPFEYFRAPR